MDKVDELLEALDALSKQPQTKATRGRLTKLKEWLGEAGAEREVAGIYGSHRLRSEVSVPRRGKRGTVILDLLYQLDSGQFVLVEAKYGVSQAGRTNDTRTFLVEASKNKVKKVPLPLKRQIEQLDALWIKDRIEEIAKNNKALAKALREAIGGERLIVLEVRSRVDPGTGQLTSQVTDHTERFREQATSGRRFIDQERRFARREALGTRQLKSLAAKTKELEKVAKDARKAQTAAQSKLNQSRARLAKLKDTPGKPLTTAQVAARQRWNQAVADQQRTFEALKLATADAEAALAGHASDVEQTAKLREGATLARKAEEKTKRLYQLERLQAGAASGKLDDAARGLLDRRTEPAVGQLNAERGLASHEPTAKKLVDAGNELATVGRAPGRGRVLRLGLVGLKVVASVGRFAFRVLDFASPIFNLLDAVALVDALVAWIRRDKVEEEREWVRIGTYLFSHPEIVRTTYGVKYATAMGNHLEVRFRHRMADPRFADNIFFWFARWSDPNWSGFVYLTADAELERQESNQDDDPYRVKYYWDTIPMVSFSDKPPRNAKTNRVIKHAGAQDEDNRSTGGKPLPYNSPGYNLAVEISTLKVRYTYPRPYLTPFDFMIMKCNNLIASIIEFVSNYDEQIISEMDVSDEVFEGVRVYWLNKHVFSAPLDSDAVHRSLLTLIEAVRLLSLHAHGSGDSKRPALQPDVQQRVLPAQGDPHAVVRQQCQTPRPSAIRLHRGPAWTASGQAPALPR